MLNERPGRARRHSSGGESRAPSPAPGALGPRPPSPRARCAAAVGPAEQPGSLRTRQGQGRVTDRE